ncbi:MAG: ATP synthase subunit b [Planctomycetes bacterium ADurb.Bin401]|nr:MAG: ATP synthase subunit b [Planctomycetes bacterium ADurb.Bin401]
MKKVSTAILFALLFVRIAIGEDAAHAEESTSIFSGTFADALWAVIAFSTLVIVLSLVAWKPLLKNLNAREDHIKQQIGDAENAKIKAEEILDGYKKQSHEMLEQATRYANQTGKELIEQARKEATAITERANSEISNAQNVASQQLWHMAGNMLIAISHEVLGRTITPEDNKRLIHEAIGKLQEESLKNDNFES